MAGERSADDIQRDIEQSRVALAAAVDQLAYRGNPKRIVEKTTQSLRARANSPQGRVVIGVTGGLLVLVIVRRVQNSRGSSRRK
ncbi:DUF3618 domain-containing protein [uncultured Jatrophihabitans sp.]|uniref:DUF3618 domain-containing protein n=1 Tax=uncultured Jatrophihabitans sp. TaxID=1610747 RepID=UPI0035CBEA70